MSFVEAISSGFKNYVGFSGRASRSEYWFWALFVWVGFIVAAIVDGVLGTLNAQAGMGILSGLFGLVMILPCIAVGVRRLHDTDRSGWWLLIDFVPLVGIILVIVRFCTKGTTGPNRFGSDPLARMAFARA